MIPCWAWPEGFLFILLSYQLLPYSLVCCIKVVCRLIAIFTSSRRSSRQSAPERDSLESTLLVSWRSISCAMVNNNNSCCMRTITQRGFHLTEESSFNTSLSRNLPITAMYTFYYLFRRSYRLTYRTCHLYKIESFPVPIHERTVTVECHGFSRLVNDAVTTCIW